MSRRSDAVTAVAVAAAIAGAAGAARADSSLHATLTASGGYTDNVLNSPENDPMRPIESDYFSQISPGLVFTQETRRVIHVASYSFAASLFAGRSEANSFSNRANWQGIVALSARSELSLALGGANGQINTFSLIDLDAAGDDLLPQGSLDYVSATAQQGYRLQINRDWSMQQSATVRFFKPIGDETDQGSNTFVALSGGSTRGWQNDALQMDMRLDYNVNGGGTAADGAMIDANEQIMAGPEVRWLHDLSERWSTELNAGALAVMEASDFSRLLVVPTGTAAIRYTRERGRIELAYSHAVAPNIFIAQITANDRVRLRGGLPIPYVDRASFTTQVALQRGRILDLENQELAGTTEQLVIDAGLAWQPKRALTVAARWQTVRQKRDTDVLGIEGLARNQVLFSLTARYPGRQAATVPQRENVRADGADEGGFGEVVDPNASGGASRR